MRWYSITNPKRERGVLAHASGYLALAILCGAMTPVFGQATAPPVEPQKNVVEALPEKQPNWLDGYQLRYTLRLMGLSPAQSTSKSIVARLPTGGWLKPDGSDLAVVCADGTTLPVSV